MHTKPAAPAKSEESIVSVIRITASLPQGELPRPEHAPTSLQYNSPLQQSGSLPARDEDRIRRATYAERRLNRYL